MEKMDEKLKKFKEHNEKLEECCGVLQKLNDKIFYLKLQNLDIFIKTKIEQLEENINSSNVPTCNCDPEQINELTESHNDLVGVVEQLQTDIDSFVQCTEECQNCKKMHFPRIEPCIIVVVEKDGKILLARHIHRNQDIYACVAGFIEAGESAEQAVERELFEETGIKVKNVTYRGSQSWPFPDQLMLGFTAEYQSGEINIQKEEIADAQFFDPNNLPPSPKEGSIAYRLINKIY